ncbi:putative TIM-barrel fold metal-dependent hydrolase [Kribbella aluminosa]|uniref:TIM-barrel fold metal-dependent hydrolase n=1 Tax=Kribbella aluminosa TaxID=416017 RepID=A0ABS4UFV1_9ACTN|nr:amidohydrolase family protein [Kribbella aluminosa]MBP2350518.1 putative TIM-barrel fold metal-dependent hydrolase [Kribbella aluminosa]
MIVDVHSHLFTCPDDIDDPFRGEVSRAHGGPVDLTVKYADYAATAPDGTRTIVVGGKARRSGLWVEDDDVAAYVAEHPDQLIGYLSLDPTHPGWRDELRHGHQELGLRGIKLMPMYAGFDPADPAYDDLYSYAESHNLPLLIHTGTTFVSTAPLRWALPVHIDEVAIRHPELRIVLAHLSHPFEGGCIAVIRKHRHVYADVSALHYRPFQLWHSLRLVQDYRVWDKLLFGSDFPFTTVDASIEGLRRVAAVPGIPGLDPLDADQVEALIHRDALPLLGLT